MRILDDAPLAIFLLDPSGACTAVNPAFTALTGLQLPDALGAGWQKLFNAQDRLEIARLFESSGSEQRVSGSEQHAFASERQAFASEQQAFASEQRVSVSEQQAFAREILVGPEEGRRTLACCLSALSGPGDRASGFVGCLADLSARKHAAETKALLDASEERQRLAEQLRRAEEWSSIVERVGQFALWTLAPGQDRPVWSKEMFALWGRKPEDGAPLVSELFERAAPEDRERIAQSTARLFSGHPDELEYSFTGFDGVVRWLHARREAILDRDGKLLHVLGIAQDVTFLHEAQRERKRHDRLLGSIAHALPDPAFVHDGETILFANSAAASLLGWDHRDQLARQPVQSLLAARDREAEKVRWHRALAGENSPGLELALLRRDGSSCPTELTSLAAEYDGRAVVLETARDLSARRAAEEQRLISDRAGALATLASGVAHEVNNPLAWLQSNLEMITDGLMELGKGNPSKRMSELLAMSREAREGALRVRTIVRDLQTFASAEQFDSMPQDPTDALELALRLVEGQLQQALSGRLSVIKRYEPVPLVRIDRVRLAQALMNIVTNAAQAMAQGNPKDNQLRLAVSATVDGGAQIEIADNGPGIAPENLPRIFEPFFTTKPLGSGTGLGLSVALNAVKAMGGTINVLSQPGHGATFRIAFPRAELAAPMPERAPPDTARTRGPRVLVVDDDPLIGQSLRRLLGRECEVVISTSASGALAAVAENPEFGLLLIDLMMPGDDGIALFEKLQLRAPELAKRVIFMTGGAVSKREREFLATGPRTLVEKPFESGRVRALVRDALQATAPTLRSNERR